MKSSGNGLKWPYHVLSSKELTIGLLPVLCLLLAVTTFTEGNVPIIWNIISGLLWLLVINLTLCTIQRIKILPGPVLIMHIGVIIAFAGGGVSSLGFVATVNIYEGDAAAKVYRWDIEKDVSPGVEIMIKKLHEEYYPVPVKVGVLRDGEKFGLYVLRTGEDFRLEEYTIKVDELELYAKKLKLNVYHKGDFIGSADTSGAGNLPEDFPFAFKLVAYQDPVIKKTWVDMVLLRDSGIVAEGEVGVNSPLKWEGMNFYHTATNRDPASRPFVGIQITKDPGTVYVYAGFIVIALGGAYYLLRRMRGHR
ncbi:MAG: ResB-like family cytochrome C biogenesis protein [Nitrospirae bacterium]|nr:ResB-like family cytochrome C biogenesis protein [Nitrospirota bacterium]